MGRVLEPEVMEGEAEAAAYDEMDRVWGEVVFQGFAESATRMGVREGRVLDVGTGSGRIAIRLARLNPALSIEAIDLSESMLALAREHASQAGLGNITFSLADAKRLPFESQSFDLVISHQLIHQLPDPVVALREMNRVAKPGGAILVRDVRRLPEPLMSLVLPFWCLGYSPKLRELTSASFRAGLTVRQFASMIREAGIDGVRVRTHFLTHLGFERSAVPFVSPLGRQGRQQPLALRLAKWLYTSELPAF